MKASALVLAAFLCRFVSAQSTLAVPQALPAPLPNFDRRLEAAPQVAALDGDRAAALLALQARVPGVVVELNELLLTPKVVINPAGFLSDPDFGNDLPSPPLPPGLPSQAQPAGPAAPLDPDRAVKAFLNGNVDLFGHGAEVLAPAPIAREFVTAHNGMRTVVWEQQLDGIPIFEAVLIGHISKDGELVCLSSQFLPNPEQASHLDALSRQGLATGPPISAVQALAIAAGNIEDPLQPETITAVDASPVGPEQRQRFKADQLLSEAEAALVWLPLDRTTLSLCWAVTLTGQTRNETYHVVIDAMSGQPLIRHCRTDYAQTATYHVFTGDSPSPFSPGWPYPNTNQPAYVSQSDVTWTALSTNASPAGWINTNAAVFRFINSSIGNNVDAHLDTNNVNPSYDFPVSPPRPVGTLNGSILAFTGSDFTVDLTQAPSTTPNQNAAVMNAFYWCNWMHDRLYDLGFTEAAGNCQYDNFGRGGVGP